MPTNRAALASMFTTHPKVWLTRDQIETVAGAEATRRLRELRQSGMYIEYSPKQGYRYLPIERVPGQRRFLCPTCGGEGIPDDGMTLMDDRYAPGRCLAHKRITLIREDVYRG